MRLISRYRARFIALAGNALSGDSLKSSVFRGGAWLGTGMFAEQAARFGRNMLLARLLAPAAFGTMAIALSATSIIQTMADLGVRDAVIQNPRGAEAEYVNASWWISMGRALLLAVALCLLSPWIANFYGNPELGPLFRVCALGLLLSGSTSPGLSVAIKQMKFRKVAIVTHGGGLCGVVFTVCLSFYIRDVWALAIGYAGESAACSILSFVLCPFRPRLKWCGAAARDLTSFSKRMIGLSLLNLIFARTDIFVLGKLRTAAELGLYTMAVNLVQTPTSFAMNLLGRTILPALSHVQDNVARMNRVLLTVMSLLMAVGIPALVFVLFCGRPLLTLVYGHRYSTAAGPFVVATAVALVNLLNGQITSVFSAIGRPNLHRWCVAIMAGVMLFLIYPMIAHFGVVGGQLAALVAVVVGFLFQAMRVHEITGLDLSQHRGVLIRAIAVSVCVPAACLGLRWLSVSRQPLGSVVIGASGCLVAYSITAFLLVRQRPWTTVE